MLFEQRKLKGLFCARAQPALDDRGFFTRLFCQKEFLSTGREVKIVQVSHSLTKKAGSVRGMHYQFPPHCEAKLVCCIHGSIFDVAVDLRKKSETYLKWHGEVISADNNKMMFIPEGFAHGFQTLDDNCEILYFMTEYHAESYEGGLRYDDPVLKITWPQPIGNVSRRDQGHPLISEQFKGIDI